MSALEEIRATRIRKREEEGAGDAYPSTVSRTHTLKELEAKFSALHTKKTSVKAVGRVRGLRSHGGSLFFDLDDGTGTMQAYIQRHVVGDESFHLFENMVDTGDFVEVQGVPFFTKKRERTLSLSLWRILAKSIRPLPEKWHGLTDVEERFRNRALDVLMNSEVRARFETRSRLLKSLRTFFEKEGFQEVETPLLHPIPGGALARPFVTHHNALNTDFYLRIAPELYLKRLLVGGLPKVFEMGRCFRNEGIDVTHNPEFTMLEAYAAYDDAFGFMKLVERLFEKVTKEITGKNTVVFNGQDIVLKNGFRRMKFEEALARYALLPNFFDQPKKALMVATKQMGVVVEERASQGKIGDEIFRKVVRPHLIQPTFITHQPLDISPLAKESHEFFGRAERFQLVVGGIELVNGYSELNDPLEQRERFEAQEKMRASGEEEVTRLDENYLEALEYGMPPAAGLGIGVDRLVQLLTDTHNIKEVILFPTLRPR
ncbi:MAG: lysine--tRNA ligase [Patescibacteria group bacterium]